jgi:hypothetical protein
MSYRFSWYVPRRVIYIHMEGILTLGDLGALKEESRTFALNGDAPVHAIIDCLEVTGLPHDLPGILRGMREGETPLAGAFSVIVTSNRLAQFLSATLFQLLKLELRIAPTVADAFDILTRFDATLLTTTESPNLIP